MLSLRCFHDRFARRSVESRGAWRFSVLGNGRGGNGTRVHARGGGLVKRGRVGPGQRSISFSFEFMQSTPSRFLRVALKVAWTVVPGRQAWPRAHVR